MERPGRLVRRSAPLLLAALGACAPVQVTAGYPWVESSAVELHDERLVITLHPDHADVEARMTFRARRAVGPSEAGFPEDRRDPALERFTAAVDGAPLEVRVGAAGLTAGFIPLADVRRWRVFTLPPLGAGARHTLVVRYRQPLDGGVFRYLIRTGAYWRGPIATLEVSVSLNDVALRSARLDGQPGRAVAGAVTWSVRGIEPREDLIIEYTPLKRSTAGQPARSITEDT